MTTSSPTAPMHNLAFPLNINGTTGPSTAATYTLPAATTYTVTYGGGATGGGGVNWTAAAPASAPAYTDAGNANITYNEATALNPHSISVKGEAEIQGTLSIGKDIIMKGKSLESRLAEIETRLAILHSNPELEAKWEGLRKLGEEYRVMEKDVVEKEKIWAILQGPDIPY